MTILGARYGNEQNSLDAGVIIVTDDLGEVSTSTADAPYSGGAWEELQAWLAAGNAIAAYMPRVKE